MQPDFCLDWYMLYIRAKMPQFKSNVCNVFVMSDISERNKVIKFIWASGQLRFEVFRPPKGLCGCLLGPTF